MFQNSLPVLLCYVTRAVMFGGALHDIPKDGFEGDWSLRSRSDLKWPLAGASLWPISYNYNSLCGWEWWSPTARTKSENVTSLSCYRSRLLQVVRHSKRFLTIKLAWAVWGLEEGKKLSSSSYFIHTTAKQVTSHRWLGNGQNENHSCKACKTIALHVEYENLWRSCRSSRGGY